MSGEIIRKILEKIIGYNIPGNRQKKSRGTIWEQICVDFSKIFSSRIPPGIYPEKFLGNPPVFSAGNPVRISKEIFGRIPTKIFIKVPQISLEEFLLGITGRISD